MAYASGKPRDVFTSSHNRMRRPRSRRLVYTGRLKARWVMFDGNIRDFSTAGGNVPRLLPTRSPFGAENLSVISSYKVDASSRDRAKTSANHPRNQVPPERIGSRVAVDFTGPPERIGSRVALALAATAVARAVCAMDQDAPRRLRSHRHARGGSWVGFASAQEWGLLSSTCRGAAGQSEFARQGVAGTRRQL